MKSGNRGQFTTPPTLLLTILVAIGIASVGMVVVDGAYDPEEWEENREYFEQYCTERFGEDVQVWVGGGQGVHSGLHCEDAEHKPVHLGAVQPETWENYKNGDASTEDVTTSLRHVGFMGIVGGLETYVMPMGATAVGFVGIGLIRQFRQ